MSLFNYKGKNKEGSVVTGTVEADNESRAVEVLESHGLTPISFAKASGINSIEGFLATFSRVSPKDLVVFFRQLATLINAQIRIVTALRILVKQVSSQKFRNIIESLASEVEGGASLSDGLSHYPQLFPELYTSLVRAGEASGSLDKALVYLAEQVEKDYDLRSKIRGAMIYPAFIVGLIFVVGGLMMGFVIPQMTAVLLEAGAELPIMTKIIIGASNIVQSYWYIIILGSIALFFGARYYLKKAEGRYLFDQTLLKIPGIKTFLEKVYMYRFSHHASNLIAGGISINKALVLIADVIGNMVYRDIFLQSASEIQTGKSLSEVLQGYPQIPSLVFQMVAVGEETGDIHGLLGKLATFYDKEVEAGIAKLTVLIEPIIMVILGLAVGIMVAGILLPMYNLASAF